MTTDKKTTGKTLEELLLEVQTELKAPKNLRNTFGNYNYRSNESILEAVKPLLKERGLLLTLEDELVNIGERYYIKAVATLRGGGVIQVSAYAREEENKKGNDSAQVTGATSSYARKYALNGLFLIDDTKDPDSDEYQGKSTKTVAPAPVPSKSTNDKPYLNKGTESYDKVVKALTEKKATLDQVQLKYKLSSVVRKELENLV